MILEVRHLRVVDAISREGTVSKAAQRLFVTQPAVSHALRDLEDRLGVELFRREGRRMRPTAEGNRLLRTATTVLQELERAEHDLAQFQAGRYGVLRVTTACYTCYHWLPRILGGFLKDFPGVDLQIVPEESARAVEALLEEKLDLAIIHERAERDDIVEEQLFRDELVAVTAAGHPLASRQFLTARDFADQHLILHSDPRGSAIFRQLLSPAGVVPERISQLRLTGAVIEAVKAGLGISALARWVAAPAIESGHLQALRLTPEGLYRNWTAAMLRRRAPWPPLAALVKLLREQAGAQTSSPGGD